MSAELPFAIAGAVDLCLKYGVELQKICRAFKGAEPQLGERSLRLENGWYRCITQLQFIKEMHHTMNDAYRALQERTLQVLVGKLAAATTILRGLVKPEIISDGTTVEVNLVPKPLKYALKKERLDEAIESLESWQRMYDPSWFLILRMSDMRLGKMLTTDDAPVKDTIPSISKIFNNLKESSSHTDSSSGLRLPSSALLKMDVSDIHLSTSQTATNSRHDKTTTYILDLIEDRSNLVEERIRDARELARRLQHDEPRTFGLLQCKGFVVKDGDLVAQPSSSKQVTMVFRTPEGLSNPRSLRDYLTNTGKPDSLSQRFTVAKELAKAISYVHSFGFVHKNVRPETIVRFDSVEGNQAVLFLVGFSCFRGESGRSPGSGDSSIEKNLYRHPARQGVSPEWYFVMQHDIYSLGVCLLEIGLWQTLVVYDASTKKYSLSSVFQLPFGMAEELLLQFIKTESKDRLLELARTELRMCMGTRYSEVVVTCLTCLDEDNTDFGDPREFEDADGVRVGVRYIEKVLHQLNSINV